MLRTWVMDEPLTRLSDVLSEQGIRLVFAAVSLSIFGMLIVPDPYSTAFLGSAMALIALAILSQLIIGLRQIRGQAMIRNVTSVSAQDPTPCVIVALDGSLSYYNHAAQEHFSLSRGSTLSAVLGNFFASPAAIIRRLQDQAQAAGNAREDVYAPNHHTRLSVQPLDEAGFLWRFDQLSPHASPQSHESRFPVIEVNSSGSILSMNETAQNLIGGHATQLDRIFQALPLCSDNVYDLTSAQGIVRKRVLLFDRDDGGQSVYLLPSNKKREGLLEAYESGLEDLPVGLLQLSSDGTILAANRLARELVAPQNADVVGACLTERLEGLGRPVRDWLDDAVGGRGLGRPEVLRVCAPDLEAYLQVTLGQVQGPGDVRLVAVLSDATKLKTLEAQFVQSQKMQAIGQLAGGVAHDFNNLLTAISGHCDLMMLRHDQGDPDYADLVQIHQNANRAASLVGQLLAFSRKQTLQPQVIDLRDTLADLTHLLNRLVGEKVALTLHHEPGLPTIRADRRQLEQVFMNLVVNARDAMPDGGEIRVETMERFLEEEYRRDRAKLAPGRYVVVKVEDHGSGIPTDKLAKIFEPFFTTKRTGEGTGLGLSTAYGIVKQSGGFIFADSVLGGGTVFTLYFPVYERSAEVNRQPEIEAEVSMIEAQVQPAMAVGQNTQSATVQRFPEGVKFDGIAPVTSKGQSKSAAAKIDGNQDSLSEKADLGIWQAEFFESPKPQELSKKIESENTSEEEPTTDSVILLVEDEAPVRAFASRALRMRGYTVIEAENAEEALATLEDPSLKIDVFVTDVIMPGMDGPTWVRKALETRPDVKVVFVSGYAEDSFGDEQARIPNSTFLPKPFSLSELTATVQDQIH